MKLDFEQQIRDMEQRRELRSAKKEHAEYEDMSIATRSELERKDKQIADMRQKIPELLAELDDKCRECEQYRETARKYEMELAHENDELSGSPSKYGGNERLKEVYDKMACWHFIL